MTDQGENSYDVFALAYAASTETNVWNAYHEWPAGLAMAGDVAGKRELDAGCGAGAHAAALLERGAWVTGVDSSAGMLAIAADRLGKAADLHLADLTDLLPLADATFDVVLASLVMHYSRDWEPTLSKFRRVLISGGLLVFPPITPFGPSAIWSRRLFRHL